MSVGVRRCTLSSTLLVGDPAEVAIKIAMAGSQLGDSGDQAPLVCLEDLVRLDAEAPHVFAPFLWY